MPLDWGLAFCATWRRPIEWMLCSLRGLQWPGTMPLGRIVLTMLAFGGEQCNNVQGQDKTPVSGLARLMVQDKTSYSLSRSTVLNVF